jgi:single-stranded DNA-specific DHH superfamily exonuclease
VIILEKDTSKQEEILRQYIDIATLGTIADCMPLIGENRIIATL